MKFVEPIRDLDKIREMANLAYSRSPRDYCLFKLGINVGLRISDLLRLKWTDLYNEDGTFRDHVHTIDMKTNKPNKFILNKNAREAVDYWKSKCPPDRPYVFNTSTYPDWYMDRSTAYMIIKSLAREVGLENIGTHSLRKTMAYHASRLDNPVYVYKMLNSNFDADISMYTCPDELTQEQLDAAHLSLPWL